MFLSTQPALIFSSHSSTGGSFLGLPLKTGPSFHCSRTGSRSKGLILNASSTLFMLSTKNERISVVVGEGCGRYVNWLAEIIKVAKICHIYRC